MNQKKKFILRYRGMISIIVLLLLANTLWAESLTQQAQQALLKGDWTEVLAVLEKSHIKDADVPCRMVAAHACLATNRNNTSMLLFLSAKEDKDLQLWSEWTESLLNRHPRNPIALYLSADAQARKGRPKESIEGFTKALDVKKDFALALNARGIVRVLNNEWDEAVIDFLQATKCDPKLADAHANLGTYWVIREAPDGAIEAFNKAIALNPEFAIAYNGIGCAYFGKGDFEKATHNFRITSRLSPILVVAEINQGYASTYASRLVALANMGKKQGTTLESMMQQYSDTLREQQTQSLKMLPPQKDREFWTKMDALPWILQSEDKTRSLISEYGLQNVQMGAFLKTQEYKSRIAETNQKVQKLHTRLNSYDTKIWNVRVAETVTSLGFSSLGTAGDLQKGWEIAQLKTELSIEKGVLSSIATNQNLKTIIDAVPLSLSPSALAASTASSGFAIGRTYLEDRRGAINVEFESLTSQIPVWGAQLRAIETNLGRLSNISISQPVSKLSSSAIPGYYTTIDHPLTEMGAIASMVNKSISKPLDGSLRRALVVAQDPFRATIQQQELNRYGFETRLVPPTINVQAEAKKWGADVISGIRGTTKIEVPQIKGITIKDTPKWDWGKRFTPTYPKGSPGGISTEELARSFVDKGNWPVLTFFGLFY